MADPGARKAAEEFIASHKLRWMRVVFTDLHGALLGKAFPAGEYLRHLETGFRFSEGVFRSDVTGRWVAPAGLMSETGSRDCIASPDTSTYCTVPWQPHMGQVIADLFSPDGTPFPYSPRALLRRVLSFARESRVTPIVASELEFYVVTSDLHQPVLPKSRYYDALDLLQPDAFLVDALSSLETMHIPVEAVIQEAGPGQFEINLRHAAALRMADLTVLFKSAIKETARKHGLIATFMAKPFGDHPGSGFHLHQSLWDDDGRSNLFSPDHGTGPSRTALQFVAGQLRHLQGAAVFFLPSVNAYKRLRRESFTPMTCTWGYDNRTVAIRVPEAKGPGSRVENRVPAADANPYLVLAASLASGLLGMRDGAAPPEPIAGDARALRAAPELPRSLSAALAALVEDTFFCETLGSDFVDLLIAVKRSEQEQYDRYITEWERRVYLEGS